MEGTEKRSRTAEVMPGKILYFQVGQGGGWKGISVKTDASVERECRLGEGGALVVCVGLNLSGSFY